MGQMYVPDEQPGGLGYVTDEQPGGLGYIPEKLKTNPKKSAEEFNLHKVVKEAASKDTGMKAGGFVPHGEHFKKHAAGFKSHDDHVKSMCGGGMTKGKK